MTTAELAALIHRETGLPEHEILSTVDFCDEDNAHLANPLNNEHPKTVFYFRPRAAPLSGDEPVHGCYLVFRFIGHNGDMWVASLASRRATEEDILGGAGITNAFTTFEVAIVDGRVARYEVFYRDDATGERRRFDKEAQFDSESPFGTLQGLTLRWLDG
jgi:hypothetical protein